MADATALRRERRIRPRCRDSLKKVRRAPVLISLPARLALSRPSALTGPKGSTSSRHRDIQRVAGPSCPSTRLRAGLGRGWARAQRYLQMAGAEIPDGTLRARVLLFPRMRKPPPAQVAAQVPAQARAATSHVKFPAHLPLVRLFQTRQ